MTRKHLTSQKQSQRTSLFIKNFIFGVEDSLVSSSGLLSGIAAAQVPRHTIVLTGIILIFVEAFSMGIGSFLSEQSAQEFTKGTEKISSVNIKSAIVMFLSYFLAGFIPLFPYALFSTPQSFYLSVSMSLAALFFLGFLSAKYFSHKDQIRHALYMFLIGGGAIIIGVVVGKILQI